MKYGLEIIVDSAVQNHATKSVGMVAIDQFKDTIHEQPETCKIIFGDEQMRKHFPKILYGIWVNIRETENASVIETAHIAEIETTLGTNIKSEVGGSPKVSSKSSKKSSLP